MEKRDHHGVVEIYLVGRQPLFGSVPGRPRILVETPATVSLSINTVTGSVFVERRKGEVGIETHAGDVFVDDSAGTLRIDSKTGDIRVENSLEIVRCTSTTGDITVELRNSPADLAFDVKTTTGDIIFTNEKNRRSGVPVL